MEVDESVADRMAGRKWAEEVLAALEGDSIAFRSGFWREVKRRLKPRELSTRAMSDERAKAFGNRVIGFGMHKFDRYDDVPLDYLEWLADQGAELLSYLESRRIREERREL